MEARISTLVLGDRVEGTSIVLNFEGAQVTLLFEKNSKVVVKAPTTVKVLRGELVDQDQSPE
jgi:sRNA-binding carbon storage regulator CsrA